MRYFPCLIASLFFAAAGAADPAATVTVTPEENGDWRVVYTFDEPPAFAGFARTGNDYRTATWTLETEGVRFGRVSGVDTIAFDEPVEEVAFSIIPLTGKLEADYTPFVPFGDGGLAIHEGQFSLIPFGSLDEIEALDGDMNEAERERIALTFRTRADKPIIVDGEVFEDEIAHTVEGDGTYVYIGDGEVEAFTSFTAVLDKTLPDWLQDRFDGDLEDIFSRLEALWGYPLEDKATVLLAFKGASGKGMQAQGGALDQLLMMELGGQDLAEANEGTLSYLQWFFAHEAVHLFQTEQGVSFAADDEAWIHEGAANTMAYNLVASTMDGGGKAFLASVYSNAFDQCVAALERGSLATVAERADTQSHYACGDFIALATDGFLKRRDLYGFWTRLTERAAATDSKEVTASLYFTTMQLLGATRAQRDMIRSLVEDELEDPREALKALLEKAGLNPQFDLKGKLVSLDWPDYSAE